MHVTVTFRPRRQADRVLELGASATVADVLAAVGQSRDSTLVLRGREPITEDDALADGDAITLLSAFSGG